jgi:hypothetical protein
MSRNDRVPSSAAPSPGAPQPVHHLNQIELSRRWKVSPRTLERWRWLGQGPRFMKLGGRVAYRLEDVEAFSFAKSRRGRGRPVLGTHEPTRMRRFSLSCARAHHVLM